MMMGITKFIFAPLLASDFSGMAMVAIAMLLSLVSVGLSLVAIVFLSIATYRVRGTTLVAPLVWMMLSLVLWACGVFSPLRDAQGSPLPADRQAIVSVALLSMCCPIVAVLGARRPQNRIWPLVVGSLLAILILPELPSVLGQGDRDLAHSVWKWFFAGLLVVGWLNYLPTRLMLATTLWCLPGISWVLNGEMHWSLMFAPGLASIVGVLSVRRWGRARSDLGWNRVWRDFCNLYGVVWALRVMERTNALADSVGAAVALDWWGFYAIRQDSASKESASAARDAPAADEMAKVDAGLRNLLRRFVSNRWIDDRLGPVSIDE